ncbi:hypothetical protein CHUAL_008389 [Chamberlinius hualienensis]
MKFDDILLEIGECGIYQKIIVLFLYLPNLFLSMQDMGYIFTSAIPNYRCYVDGCDNDTTTYEEDFLNFTTPYDYHYDRFSQCQLYIFENDTSPHVNNCQNKMIDPTSIYNCDKWKYDTSDYTSTVVAQFNLVCDHDNLAALSQSIYMIGNMFGGLLAGMAADKYGRKKVVYICLAIVLALGVSSAFVPNFSFYLVLRFFLGGTSQGAFIILFVMSVEIVGKSFRGTTGMLINVAYSMGEVAFGGFAFAIRDWRFLQVAISAPCVLFLLYFWYKKKLNYEVKVELKFQYHFEPSNTVTEVENLTWIDLFRTSYMRMITINMCISWFMVTMAYFGITMSAPSMSGNQYINFIIVSAVEIPAYIFGILAMEKFGRRYILCFSMIFGGVAGICTAIVPNTSEYSWLTITLATLGKFGAAAAFAVIYVFTAELYPTGIRNNGIAFSSFAGHLGSVIAPYIAQLTTVNAYLPLAIFGLCSLISGLMGLSLPETLGKRLPETIKDCENMSVCWCSPKCSNARRGL